MERCHRVVFFCAFSLLLYRCDIHSFVFLCDDTLGGTFVRTFFFSSLIPTHKPVGCDAISNWIDRRGIAAEAAGGWGYVTSPEKEMETSFPPLGLLAFPSPTLIKDQKTNPGTNPP